MQRPMLRWVAVAVIASAILCMLVAMGMYAGMQVVTRALRTTELAIATLPSEMALPPAASDSLTPEARVTAVAVSPGRILALADDGNILTLQADGSDPRALTQDASTTRIYRQPTWSPSGERVAWAEIVTGGADLSTALRTARIDGSDATSADAEGYPPFYIHWGPGGTRLAYLSNWTRGLALRTVDLSGGGSQAVTLGEGQPYYFDWAPGERRMLTHVGGERLALLSLDGSETRLPGLSGVFGAPQWSADGERLLYAVRDGDGQRLVLAGVDGQRQRDVLPFDGQLSFSLSPDGRKIAYAITTRPVAAASFGPLSVLDLATGESTQVSTHPALGFFWSPDSRSLIYLLPADIGPQAPRASLAAAADDDLWLRWHLWSGAESQELARFAPSATFLIDYLRFFDQYARSMTPWSPDSRAFVYAGGGEDGRTGIWVQPVIDDLAPVRISDGTYAAWSPR
jgi:TolB protein